MKRDNANVLLAASTCVFIMASASTSLALSQAPGLMPWDSLLNTVASWLTDVVAPAALKLGVAAAMVAFALSGARHATRQLARLALGAALALMAVRLSTPSFRIRWHRDPAQFRPNGWLQPPPRADVLRTWRSCDTSLIA